MRPGSTRSQYVFAGFIIICFLAVAGCTGGQMPGPVVSESTSPVPPPHPPHILPLYYQSLYAMQGRLAPAVTLSLPTHLPEGFFMTMGSQTGGYGGSALDQAHFSFYYQRGQEESISFGEQSRNSTTCPDEPVYQPAAVGITRTQREGTGELTWGKDGWCFTLSGALSEEELEEIAESVIPVPYREGVMPPGEFQPPEHPIVREFAVNRSSTENGVTVTVRSLSCTPEACEAAIRVGTAPAGPARTPLPSVTTMPPVGSSPRAEWRVDGGRPLLTMPGGGMRFNESSIFWKIEPLPEGSRELGASFSRINGIDGLWQIAIPLDNPLSDDATDTARQEASP